MAGMRRSKWPTAASDDDFAPYLAGRPSTSADMFWRFVELARAAGQVTFELQTGPVVLCGTRRIFASVRVTDGGLAGLVNLPRRLADRRIVRAEELTKRLVMNRYRISALADLDAEFAGWLAEAREVGDGVHLGR